MVAQRADGCSCSLLLHLTRCQRPGKQGVEQTAAGVVACSKAFLQPIAERHQRIDLGDDPVLFGEGWKGDQQRLNSDPYRGKAAPPL